MTLCPAAEAIKEALGVSDLDAAFLEVAHWYKWFRDATRITVLPYCPEDVEILHLKREDCRQDRDWKTADAIRDALILAGLKIRDKPIHA